VYAARKRAEMLPPIYRALSSCSRVMSFLYYYLYIFILILFTFKYTSLYIAYQ